MRFSREPLFESLSEEEKMDMWYEGTRNFNYKAAGDPKLKRYYNICIEKGYEREANIIANELDRRGVNVFGYKEMDRPTSRPAPKPNDSKKPSSWAIYWDTLAKYGKKIGVISNRPLREPWRKAREIKGRLDLDKLENLEWFCATKGLKGPVFDKACEADLKKIGMADLKTTPMFDLKELEDYCR